jgi:methionyl-tRNA formyltransferase
MTKQILCITYRDWALEIYKMLTDALPQYNFKIIFNDAKNIDASAIKTFQPDIILWYGWSWIVPASIVEQYDCMCLHPSPLPKYRGGSPLQNQILNGEKSSAVTIFKMSAGLDDGDIVRQTPMSLQGNIEDIFLRMTTLGFAATCDFLKNGYNLKPQDHSAATLFKRRKPADSEITLDEIQSQSREYIYNKIRMLTGPYPNAFIKDKDGKKLYITNAHTNGN